MVLMKTGRQEIVEIIEVGSVYPAQGKENSIKIKSVQGFYVYVRSVSGDTDAFYQTLLFGLQNCIERTAGAQHHA